MEIDWIYRLVLLAILLILSAFFSGSEVALFSIKKGNLKNLEKKSGLIGKYINNLLEFPRRLLVTILLGNTVINVAASIIAVTLSLEFAEAYGYSVELVLFIQIVLLTILIIIIGEITPKVWATKYPMQFSIVVAVPLYWISVLLYPIAKILSDLIKIFFAKLKYDKSRTALLSSEISDLADLGVEKGTIEEEEQELIQGLVTFKTVTVREVMTPRVDLTAISVDTPFNELMDIITESGHSRIPLYVNSLDNVVGIIYAKDLLPYLADNENKPVSLNSIAREALFIPETKLISDMLHDFQEKNMHVGIVVDEYGGTAGLISLEDILEEIVGEIRDEFDKEETEINKIDEDKYMLMGKVSIDELNDLFDYNFSSEDDDYDTVGGFILNQAGTIPEKEFGFVYEIFRFTVKDVENNRISKVMVEKISKHKHDEK